MVDKNMLVYEYILSIFSLIANGGLLEVEQISILDGTTFGCFLEMFDPEPYLSAQ